MMHPDYQLGVMVDYGSEFGREVFRGALAFTRAHPPWRVVRLSGMPETETDWLRVPGCLIGQFISAEQIGAFRSRGRRLVNISGTLAEPEVATVRVDDEAAGRMAAEYFLGKGFRNPAFIGYRDTAFSERRREGFVSNLPEPVRCHIARQGYQGVGRFLEGLEFPAGVFCANDRLAWRVLEICEELGFRIPDQVSVLGVDNDLFYSESATVPLSSVDVAARKIGYDATEWVCSEDELRPEIRLIPPTGVVSRASTDLMAVADGYVAQVMRILRERYHEPIRVSDLAEEMSIGRRMLEIRFKQATGQTPYRQLQNIRLEKAKDLLASTDMPVERVAEACGIGESRQLSALFRKEVGETPTAWRRRFTAG